MNKFLKGALCVALCGATLGMTACNKKTQLLDTENRQLQLSTAALDGNFNPFFYSSANDGNIIGMTQIGMFTNDTKGNLAYGESEAAVVLDKTETMLTASGTETTNGTEAAYTEYEYLIKKGIKFSNGEELTIDDVLFNLYVYLDPSYTGLATIYSTDIVGLKAYRYQDASLLDTDDSKTSAIESGFTATAQERISKLITWSTDSDSSSVTENRYVYPSDANQRADYETVMALFKEELNSDWTSVYSAWEDTYKEYRFTAAWQAYLYAEGLVTKQYSVDANQVYTELQDENDKFYTNLDEKQAANNTSNYTDLTYLVTELEAYVSANLSEYMSDNDLDSSDEEDVEYATLQLQKEFCVNRVYEDYYGVKNKLAEILTYWTTASEALTQFTNDARTAYYEDLKESNSGETLVKNISGITTRKTTSFNGTSYAEEYDVLTIKINGVDPKASFNFAFSVAPMSYYSGTWRGKDYIAAAKNNTANDEEFGVEVGNSTFFTEVVQTTEKNGLPVGAGAYMATDSDGSNSANRSSFYSNGIIYLKRNTNFETVDGHAVNGKDSTKIQNANIKYINYKEMNDSKIITNLAGGSIDFGMPSAIPSNINTISATSTLASESYDTGGYGYVGINPKYVPEYQVRQAIMIALDPSSTVRYYTTENASVIYRPVSTTSWSYNKTWTDYVTKDGLSYEYTGNEDVIKQLVESAGYTMQNGIYVKTDKISGQGNASSGTKLSLTFTIAGESNDHPAYTMFLEAEELLEKCGFDITVTTSTQALKYLNTGGLAVWAAAWSSAADPDPYQIYHKYSSATSVNNWNYSTILNNESEWKYEYDIIMELSDKIDEGRATLDQDERTAIYDECYSLIMELAVEYPTYQRKDLAVYNINVIDPDSLVKNPSYALGLFDRIWEINYV